MGQGWWGADSNLGFFGLESFTDGTSNTAVFSEKLIGNANGSPLPYATSGANAKRGIFLTSNIPYQDCPVVSYFLESSYGVILRH